MINLIKVPDNVKKLNAISVNKTGEIKMKCNIS